jgi:predicted phage terminase large subunit-like protein
MQLDTRAVDITKMDRYTFVDPAISVKQTADYTVILTIGVLDGDVYILDIIRERMEPDRLISQLFEVVKMYNPARVGVENVAFQKMLIQEIRKHMDARGVGFVLDEIHPMGEKEARISSSLHSKYITGRIYHLHGGDNVYELEDELLSFPLGGHDDAIDALSGAVSMIGSSMAALWKGNQKSHLFPNIT